MKKISSRIAQFDEGPWPNFTYMIVSAQATLVTDANPVDWGLQGWIQIEDGTGTYLNSFVLGPNGNEDIPANYTISTDEGTPLVEWYANDGDANLFLMAEPFDRNPLLNNTVNIVGGTLCVQWRIGE